ncbi:SDR family oxidoreductase [Leptolyngbyaceae cyanobacterium CCMR0082]|uniref:SDR family oxidoreductase n=2 Tax=Adonisia turfae TaxID=2950184 RepID=A0A6M0SD49_9CYAN|nr:SDR family oxidoreductase [Adonisia turfae]MDV3351321.1 SDR family oxidoreductase [Leptothoe sp. LEGE 181152]NEZ60220.1 SDR family oxidoreductase [Adonisia turfae CCMR0081]NEZ66246.1 SDR family oxidoreductase [Adonisia turfae CCMR0082]
MNTVPNRRALITGASTGIGRATALAFAKANFDVALVSRSTDKLKALEDEIGETATVKAQSFPLDLSIVAQIKEQVTHILEAFGPVDVLVNNAGMGYTGELNQMPLDDWCRVLDLNVTSVFQCIQAVLPGMRDRKSGMIINVASIAARQAFPEWGAYGISKAAVVALSKAISVEERNHGIRVVTILPGAVNTPLWDTDTVQADFDRSGMLTPELVANAILQTALLPPGAVVEELTIMPSGGAL